MMAASDFIGKTFVVTQRHVGNCSWGVRGVPNVTWREAGDVCFIIDALQPSSRRGHFGIICLYSSGISTIYASDDESTAFANILKVIDET
jgi:hypothetical protein